MSLFLTVYHINIYRYCEMGLWTVAPERLQSPVCSLYKIPLQLLEQGARGTASVIQKPVDTLGGFIPDLTSGRNNNSTNRNIEEPNKSNKKTTTEQTMTDGVLPQMPVPRIPFIG